jgi:hypothetical protein
MPTSNVGGSHNRIILSMSYKRTDDIPPHLIEEIVSTSLTGKKTVEKFIKGPVPVWWLRKAWTECRPASLVFGLLLFLRQGMGVKPKPITKAEMELFGIKRWSKREALEDLERAGLVLLYRKRGRLAPTLLVDRGILPGA